MILPARESSSQAGSGTCDGTPCEVTTRLLAVLPPGAVWASVSGFTGMPNGMVHRE